MTYLAAFDSGALSSSATAALTVIGLFLLGLVSPGPNFLVVVDSTLSYGRRAGIVTGLGAALGDAIYATAGLFGMSVLIAKGGYVLALIKACGGIYLAWLGLKMIARRRSQQTLATLERKENVSFLRLLMRGLASDLSNPKTVAFFASIFAFAIHADTPRAARVAMLVGIFVTSVVWRALLSVVFSTSLVQTLYRRSERVIEPIFGAILCAFGLRLMRDALLPFPNRIARFLYAP